MKKIICGICEAEVNDSTEQECSICGVIVCEDCIRTVKIQDVEGCNYCDTDYEICGGSCDELLNKICIDCAETADY